MPSGFLQIHVLFVFTKWRKKNNHRYDYRLVSEEQTVWHEKWCCSGARNDRRATRQQAIPKTNHQTTVLNSRTVLPQALLCAPHQEPLGRQKLGLGSRAPPFAVTRNLGFQILKILVLLKTSDFNCLEEFSKVHCADLFLSAWQAEYDAKNWNSWFGWHKKDREAWGWDTENADDEIHEEYDENYENEEEEARRCECGDFDNERDRDRGRDARRDLSGCCILVLLWTSLNCVC